MSIAKPAQVFGRDQEWDSLSRFVEGRAGTVLGVVYGRRRQGKTWLLEALAQATGAFVHTAAREEPEPAALLRLGSELGAHLQLPPLGFQGWDAAVDALLDLLQKERLFVCILDEFAYLLGRRPDLPSLLQRRLDRAQPRRGRLLLCGSAFSVMRDLVAAGAPLRGRAALTLRVNPFDFRTAAAFWGLSADPATALAVHAVLGGTPGYRELAGALPSSSGFEAWLEDAVLHPSSALFHEGLLLLAEEDRLADRSVYHEVLSVVVAGETRTNAIAAALGRSSASLAPLLGVLESLDLIERVPDPLRSNRWFWQIREPMLRFHHAVLAPVGLRRRFERGDRTAWRDARERFQALVQGPHFEQVCREWTERFAGERTLGLRPSLVARTELPDPEQRGNREVDVVALDESGRVLAIGEAKATRRLVGEEVLAGLLRSRDLLSARGAVAPGVRLLLFSASGFTKGLQRTAATRTDLQLVDLERLYGGD